ncbi:Uncharacterized protein Fot_04441 [Forsythia ovata]|uniref:Uncharacterized protein n=1 Tax=Forsythia ovata TaxID=205694 RepID=A0ABD1XCK9_9LAMI
MEKILSIASGTSRIAISRTGAVCDTGGGGSTKMASNTSYETSSADQWDQSPSTVMTPIKPTSAAVHLQNFPPPSATSLIKPRRWLPPVSDKLKKEPPPVFTGSKTSAIREIKWNSK